MLQQGERGVSGRLGGWLGPPGGIQAPRRRWRRASTKKHLCVCARVARHAAVQLHEFGGLVVQIDGFVLVGGACRGSGTAQRNLQAAKQL